MQAGSAIGSSIKLFERTSEILNRFSLLYRGATVPLLLEDATDYERAINLLAAAENTSRKSLDQPSRCVSLEATPESL